MDGLAMDGLTMHGSAPELSLVAPVLVEVENLRPLVERVREVFEGKLAWELLLVDDGSSDGSAALIRELAREDPRVRGVFHPENRGQTSATSSGIRFVRAPLVATLDADMQNDPFDLLEMHALLGANDAVVGYRVKREDDWVRRFSSRFANGVRNRLTGDSIRDTGCSLKLFRTDAIRAIPLFEGMHRFLPTLLRMHGYQVVEHPVSHHPRLRGLSKYGVWNRAFRSGRDLLAVRWMRSRIIRRLPPGSTTDGAG
jgi:dolichol-phosphate mannosyltransferase